MALDKQGRLFIGTGDRGEIYRVETNGTGAVFFKSDEAQIRAMQFDKSGNLIAGTDGSGLVYRISPSGEGFALYSAPKKEITALAIDGAGQHLCRGSNRQAQQCRIGLGRNVHRAGSAAPTTTIVLQQAPSATAGAPPGIAPAPFPNTLNIGGSEVYRIAADGSPKTIWTSRDDLVYALAFDATGRLIAATGNKGKLYAIGESSYTDLTKASANQVTALARAPQGGLYAATSNLGKVFLIGGSPVAEGTYESDVFDAKIFSKWGRPEVRGQGNYELFARSGNVDNPDRNWSAWKKVDLAKSGGRGCSAGAISAMEGGAAFRNTLAGDRQRRHQLPAQECRTRSGRSLGAGGLAGAVVGAHHVTPLPTLRRTTRPSRPSPTSIPSP